ncbi:zinc ABC transporter ATP-binding protein AztA [Neomegalonema sp.]|uniref:zinc ABC transporter ATP-binding protein AztA n=1 Tax=Neomegalonema sp. TaxID=2039713 RepID=UPI002615534E|nr:zinc ABC transporter ATP-binding protein AztA [Neomegalonema sp.]MDD2867603.1 zinc ABC transporter ATP-binding protein AztA [Neomegalonema sp.]
MTQNAQTPLSFDDLTLGYKSHPAVHHLSGALRAGSLTAVVGANGSGKSTLLKGIVGLLKPISGRTRIAPGLKIAYLPQQSGIDVSFPAQLRDLVGLGLWPKRGLLGRRRPEDEAAVSGALRAVGLAGFERRSLDTLSGGQLQRALFARVILQEADLILLDEPFNAVDARTIADLMSLILRWKDEGRTVLAVVHDLDLVRERFPEALLLARRLVAWGPARETLKPENLLKARRFHEAWDDAAPWCAPEPEEASPGAHVHGHGHSHDHAHDHRGAA